MTQLRDKVVWITGASSGIGEAMAIEAARKGARLVLSARRASELERVRAACPDPSRVAVLPLDLTDFDASESARAAQGFFGPIDVLVNNAGISQRGLVVDTSMDVYRRILELDFFACVALTKAVLPDMLARKSGHLVVVSSVVAYLGTPLRSGYCAAKHAVNGFFDALRAEVWREGVKVTVICPGFIRTQVTINAITGGGGQYGKMDPATERGMPPEECAQQAWRAVEQDRDEVLVGAKEAMLVRLQRWAPGLARFAIGRAKVT
jgi:short-subunit dehydrogenase